MKYTFFLIFIVFITVSSITCSVQKRADQTTMLFGQKWILYELNGKSISEITGLQNQAFIQFEQNENKVSGNGSCNNFFGTLTLKENQGIQISKLGATRMFCEQMQIEVELMTTLENTVSYSIANEQLTMISNEKTKSLRFELESKTKK